MIRLVIAVIVGVAVLAAALPAVERGATQRADDRLARFAERLETAAAGVAREPPVPPDAGGARRVVAVRLPRDRLTLAPVAHAAVGCGPHGLRVTYRLAGDRHQRAVPVPVPVAVESGNGTARSPRVSGDSRLLRGPSDRAALPGHAATRSQASVRGTPQIDSVADRLRVRLGFHLLGGTPTAIVGGGSSRKPGPPVPCSERGTAGVGLR